MLNKNIETFIGCTAGFDEADTVIYGAPFDSTTSYRPGARFGPSAIRHESYGIETYSPYQDRDLEDVSVFDSGDVELCIGDASIALSQLEERAKIIADAGKLPFLLGGEHLVTLAPVRVLAKKYPDLHIIHFDAHADLREDYLGAKLSHACVLRRCHDLLGDGRIFQFGIRSGCKEEMAWAQGRVKMEKFRADTAAEAAREIGRAPVYVTVDLDVIDPSEFPGTGTPEAGGLRFSELLDALLSLRGLDVKAFDVCELSPHYDRSGASTALACKTLREMLLAYL